MGLDDSDVFVLFWSEAAAKSNWGDTEVRAKVNPSGSIKLLAELRHGGRTFRKTIGQYPLVPLSICSLFVDIFRSSCYKSDILHFSDT